MLSLARDNPLHSAILNLLFFTGMRVGELISLTHECYRVEEEFGEQFKVLVYSAKGEKVQKRILHKNAVAALDRYLDYRREQGRSDIDPSDPLIQPSRNFFTREGELIPLVRTISASLVSKIIKKYSRLIGISNLKGYSAHSARTTLITQLIERGNDIYLVSKEIGHADVSTTQRCYDRSKRKLSESLLFNQEIY
jgi:site-specific recombinase XerD